MTEQQAIAQAQEKHERYGKDYIVVNGTHTFYGKKRYYVIAKNEKHLWAKDEVLVFDTSAPPAVLEVEFDDDGAVLIRADPITAARLAGRRIFGRISETQKALEDEIRDAWYIADCPR